MCSPGRPLVMITDENDRRLLQLAEVNPGLGLGLVVALKQISLPRVLIFCLEKDAVLRSQLHLGLGVGFGARDLIVRPAPVVILKLGIERVTHVAKDAVLRSGFAQFAGAEVGGGRTDPKAVRFE